MKFYGLLAFSFFLGFLILTPLDSYNDHIPRDLHKGYFSVIRYDNVESDGSRYEYLRSLFFDQDIDFINGPFFSTNQLNQETGFIENWWPIGTALLWFPFFLIGHFLCFLMIKFSLPLGLNGYSYPYISIISLGTIVYAYLGCVFCFKGLRRFFSERISFIAVFFSFFSTAIVYWSFIRTFMDIALDFFNFSLFSYFFLLFVLKDFKRNSFFAFWGLSAGIMASTRFNGVLYLAAMAAYMLIQIKNRTFDHLPRLKNTVTFLGAAFFAFLPQFLAQKILFNSFFNFGPALRNLSEFDPSRFLNRLCQIFAGDQGIFFQSPLFLVGIFGTFWFWRKKEELSPVRNPVGNGESARIYMKCLFMSFLLQTLMTASLTSFGNDFGIKYLAPSLVALCPGVAFLLHKVEGTRFKNILLSLLILFVFWQYIQISQHNIVASPFDFSVFQFWPLKSFFSFSPQILLRSSSFVSLLFQGQIRLGSFIDFYFIFFLPLILLFFIGTALFLIKRERGRTCLLFGVLAVVAGSNVLLMIHKKNSPLEIARRRTIYEKQLLDWESLWRAQSAIMDYQLDIKKKDGNYKFLNNYLNAGKGGP